jgi:hypothetical protein
MEQQQLKQMVACYRFKRDFVSAFNEAAGGDYLHETTLSRHLSGSLMISGPWKAAYTLFVINKKSVNLLSDLADLQNGPPLVRDEKKHNKTMSDVWSLLSGG